MLGWPKKVTRSPSRIFCVRFKAGLSVQVELATPAASQNCVPRGVNVLPLLLPGRILGIVFQVIASSPQSLLPSRSNSNPPAAILLKLALLGCWPALATLEKRVNVT